MLIGCAQTSLCFHFRRTKRVVTNNEIKVLYLRSAFHCLYFISISDYHHLPLHTHEAHPIDTKLFQTWLHHLHLAEHFTNTFGQIFPLMNNLHLSRLFNIWNPTEFATVSIIKTL